MRSVEIIFGMLSGVFLGYTLICTASLNISVAAVVLLGTATPLIACLICWIDHRSFALRFLLCFTAGLYMGSHLFIALSSVCAISPQIPSWPGPVLMAAALVVDFYHQRLPYPTSIKSGDETNLVDLRWQDALNTLDGYDRLSRREAEVLELTLAGKTTKEIGTLLSIAPSTAGSYRARVCEKLDVDTIQDVLAVVVAYQLNNERQEEFAASSAASRRHSICGVAVLFALLLLYLLGQIIYWPYLVFINAVCSGLAACGTAASLVEPRFTVVGSLGAISAGLLFPILFYGDGLALPVVAAVLFLLALRLNQRDNQAELFVFSISSGLLFPGNGFWGSVMSVPLIPLAFSALLLASAYLARDLDNQKQAANALDLVASGEVRLMSYLMGRGLSGIKAKIAILTDYGFDVKAIAKALYVSPSTVSNYRSQIYSALELENGAALVDLLKHDAGFSPLTTIGAGCNER